jgi:F-type H+-transporting ATPase subunit c
MADLVTLASTIAQAVPAVDSVAQLASYSPVGAGLAMGFAVVGGGIGIGLVGAATISGIARQPEQAGKLQGLMFVLAALIEGLALIALVFGLLMSFAPAIAAVK